MIKLRKYNYGKVQKVLIELNSRQFRNEINPFHKIAKFCSQNDILVKMWLDFFCEKRKFNLIFNLVGKFHCLRIYCVENPPLNCACWKR